MINRSPAKGLRIKSPSMDEKKKAIIELSKYITNEGDTDKFTLDIMIPESNIQTNIDMVSIVIGRAGSQIKRLQTTTKTMIYIESYKTDKSLWRHTRIAGRINRNV